MTIEIRRRVVRTAYPRNGNVANPTIEYVYDVYCNGKVYLPNCRTQREAKAAAKVAEMEKA